ncbi:hypothetical protein QBC34DRAFT_297291 [Podospora aff. communis PSN243]|uniref:Lytic polysaccharide monooxygenase n=1 Tax=Podospora aff. communis PSN243 TaxID=3040156 RepID=A0AAV9GNL2_9PEZI|nr:hypothetical protein QBC34DRAFT_297291 [Podospora aff. communis PSN243]
MRFSISALSALVAFLSTANAHMYLADPPALRSKDNKFTSDVDYSITTPIGSADKWPCKGYNNLLGTPQGSPVKTWNAGESYSFTVRGGAAHGGGSCQASISTDGGNSFKVIHSYIGNCPGGNGDSSFKFKLPSDMPSSDNALFSWTWFNLQGNREAYGDCAVVTINGGGSGSESVPFSSRPEPLAANLGNGCKTLEGKSVIFPNPGPDVDVADADGALPVGSCSAAAVAGGGGGSGSGFTPGPSPGPGSGSGSTPGSGSSPYGGDGIGYGSGGQGSGSGSATYPPIPSYTPGNDWPAGFNPNSAAVNIPRIPLLIAGVVFVIGLMV